MFAVPPKIHRTHGFHITGTPCLKQKASGIAYVPISGVSGFKLGVCSVERGSKLIDLYFREIFNYFK